jgi:hexosaminidase
MGSWESGNIGNKKPKEVTFDATGFIKKNGVYEITFIYTGGSHKLMIDGISILRNDEDFSGKDTHKGFTGKTSEKNTYKVKISNYETGASYKIKALIYGDIGDDSNGMIFIRFLKK